MLSCRRRSPRWRSVRLAAADRGRAARRARGARRPGAGPAAAAAPARGLALAVMVPVLAALALPSWRGEIVRAALWTSWPVIGRRDRLGGRPGPGAPIAAGRGGAGRGAGGRRPVGVDARRGRRRPARVRARAGRGARRRSSQPRRPPSSPRTRASTPRSSPGVRQRISSACARCRGSSTARWPAAGPCSPARRRGRRSSCGASGSRPGRDSMRRRAFSVAAVTGRLHCVPVAAAVAGTARARVHRTSGPAPAGRHAVSSKS